jgi:hypothetical protein
MTTFTLEHIKASELPAAWRKRINAGNDEMLTVTIATETPSENEQAVPINNTFGMWADREDIPDVGEYVRTLRQARFPPA